MKNLLIPPVVSLHDYVKRWIVLALFALISIQATRPLMAQPKKQPLIVFVIDASKSTISSPKPTLPELRKIEALITELGTGGTLAFAVIGNPCPKHRHFYRLTLEPVPVSRKDAPLVERARTGRNAKAIVSRNQQGFSAWLSNYRQVVLNYRPDGQELSKVSEVFGKAELLLREPAYKNHRKLLVFSSDLRNEPQKPNSVVPFKVNLNGITDLTVIGAGAPANNPLSTSPSYLPIADMTGLTANLEEVLNQ